MCLLRPGELRFAEWREFDLATAEWRIPAEKMKMDEYHLVPLSKQAVAIIRELQPFTGNGKYLFPSLRTKERPISDVALNAALRRLGFSSEEQTAHGFRTIADTFLNELGFPPDIIELQLAHKERNKVRAAYNRAQRLDERRKMMQLWADHLDSLRTGTTAAAKAATG
jgi:integrase